MHHTPAAEPDVIGHCWHCGAGLTAADYGRENHCRGCGKPTRCCRNCCNYQRGRPHDCRESTAEPVSDKERANFCEWFLPTSASDRLNPNSATPVDLRAAAEKLFRDRP